MKFSKINVDKRGKSSKIIIEPSKGVISLNLSEVWKYRELLYFLIWRDVKVRYKQTLLGVGWVILQPFLTMVVFSILFGQLAKLPSDGIPYPIFTFAAIIPWQLFTYCITQTGNSLVSNQQLITKVYFPRLVIPLAAVLSGLLDFVISFFVLFVMMIYYGIPITLNIFTLPFFLILLLVAAFAIGLLLSALNVEYRDVRYIIPFLTQIWFFLTPVAYSSSLVPKQWNSLYWLNPMVGVIEGFRWAILGKGNWDGLFLFISSLVVIGLTVFGLYYFRKMEKTFADVV